MAKIDKILGGRIVKEKLNGHMVEVLLPPSRAPSLKKLRPEFERMAKILEKRKFKLFTIPKD